MALHFHLRIEKEVRREDAHGLYSERGVEAETERGDPGIAAQREKEGMGEGLIKSWSISGKG